MNKDRIAKRGAELKSLDDSGHGLARIATLSAIDHDKDTYAPGAFGTEGQWAQILGAHNHAMVPLGKARVFERDDEALAELHFNLSTTVGKEWHAALKFDLAACCDGAPAIQEWSYGFHILDAIKETRDGEPVRVLKKLKVFEVSPVVQGAGIGTGTLQVKGRQLPFGDDIDAAIAGVAAVLQRAQEVKALRAQDERQLSAVRLQQLKQLQAGLGELVGEAEAEADTARRLYAAHVARELRFRPGG